VHLNTKERLGRSLAHPWCAQELILMRIRRDTAAVGSQSVVGGVAAGFPD
jgi:hypothetical protein